MYVHSTTPPAPPPFCPARTSGAHEPADFSCGSAFDRLFGAVQTEDGGLLWLRPCKHCGLVYWSVEQKVSVAP